MKALVGDTIVAEAPKADLILIEGNYYFPPQSVKSGALTTSPTAYTCSWKGDAQYFSVNDGDAVREDQAWSYPTPHSSADKRVGREFANYVAFGRDVRVVE